MQDLPNEVWRLIFDDLSRQDLCNVCLTNRQLQGFSQPQLFSKIEFYWGTPKNSKQATLMPELEPPLRVASLIRTLHRRPDLAEAVRRVSLRSSRPSGYVEKPKLESTKDDFKDLVQAARQLKLPFAAILSQAVSDGDVDAFVTLLLALTPRITSLRLTEEFASKTKMLSHLILYTSQHPESPASSLKQLRHVEYLSFHDLYRHNIIINTDDVTPFFYLPAIQCIVTDMQEPPIFAWPLSEPPTMANLTHLTLLNTREKTLGVLLQHAQSLQYLDWGWVYDQMFFRYHNEPVMDLDAICVALGHVCATLTTLKLRGETLSPAVDPKVELTGSMRGLKRMKAVTKLETTLQFFMGFEEREYSVPLHECLPPSVKTVCFTDDFQFHSYMELTTQHEMEAIEAWWEVKSKQTPIFEELELRYESFDVLWREAEQEELAEMGEKYDVTVRIYQIEDPYDSSFQLSTDKRWRLVA